MQIDTLSKVQKHKQNEILDFLKNFRCENCQPLSSASIETSDKVSEMAKYFILITEIKKTVRLAITSCRTSSIQNHWHTKNGISRKTSRTPTAYCRLKITGMRGN